MEAAATSEEISDVLSALLDMAYEMYDERREQKEEESWLETLVRLFMD